MAEYRERVVLRMDEDARDVVVRVMPVVLRVNVRFVQLDREMGLSEQLHSTVLAHKKFHLADALNFHSEHLSVFFRPGHYDLLYPRDTPPLIDKLSSHG